MGGVERVEGIQACACPPPPTGISAYRGWPIGLPIPARNKVIGHVGKKRIGGLGWAASRLTGREGLHIFRPTAYPTPSCTHPRTRPRAVLFGACSWVERACESVCVCSVPAVLNPLLASPLGGTPF